MVAIILPVDTPSTPGAGSKHFFLKVVMLHIKLKGLEHYEHHTSTCSVLTHTLGPRGGVKRSKQLFSESSHVAKQIKGKGA